jgi:predicted nucleic acid-binding protein
MKVFLDTNVILDHALDRDQCFANEATRILDWCAVGLVEGFISSASVYTLTYVLARAGYRNDALRQKLQTYLSWVTPLPTDALVFKSSFDSKFSDLEDAYQYNTALYAKMNYFVTGNLKDFNFKNTTPVLTVLSPADFVKRMSFLDLS